MKLKNFKDILVESKKMRKIIVPKLKHDKFKQVWISVKNAKHGPRIKIFKNNQAKGENFSVTIEENPKTIGKVFVNSKELDRIKEFIKVNERLLIDYWNYSIDTTDLAINITKV